MLLIVSFISIGISACQGDWFKTKVKILNKEVIVNYGIDGAEAFQTLVDKKRKLTKEQFDKESLGMFCVTDKAYSDTEKAIDEFCENYDVCEYLVDSEEYKKFKARMKIMLKKAKDAKDKKKIASEECIGIDCHLVE